MKFFRSWIFWLIYSLIPALLTLAFDWTRQTMVYIYFLAVLLAIVFWWILEKVDPQEEF